MPAFAQLAKEVGGPEAEGAKESIPQEPRQRLAELGGTEKSGGGVGSSSSSSSTPKGGATSDKTAKPGSAGDWIGGAEKKEPPKVASAGAGKDAQTGKGGGTTAKPGGDGGWIGSDTPAETKTKNVRPAVVDKSVAGQKRQVVDAEATPVDVKDVVGAVWTKDGKAAVFLQRDGLLRRVRVPELVEERQANIDSPCTSLAMSKEGVVAGVNGLQEVWLFDEATLELKRRVTVGSLGRVASGPATNLAIANTGDGSVSVINLTTGQTMGQVSPREVSEQRGAAPRVPMGFGMFAMTPDGKYLLTEGMGCIHRLRVEGKRLIWEENGPSIGSNPQSLVVSPDGRYVCLPSGGGNGNVPGEGPMPYTTFVYAVGDLQKRVMVIRGGAYPHTLGFDVAARQLYSQNHDTQLIVFSPTGLKGKEYKIREAGDVHLILAHPAGKKVLIVGGPVYWIELP